MSDQPPNPNGRPSANPNCNKDHCEGLVWIFYSDSYRLSQWGTINIGKINSDGRDIICHQLGYESRKTGILPDHPTVNASVPVWLSDIDCSSTPSATNILQCNHSICGISDSCNDHKYDLVIGCCKSNYVLDHTGKSVIYIYS